MQFKLAYCVLLSVLTLVPAMVLAETIIKCPLPAQIKVGSAPIIGTKDIYGWTSPQELFYGIGGKAINDVVIYVSIYDTTSLICFYRSTAHGPWSSSLGPIPIKNDEGYIAIDASREYSACNVAKDKKSFRCQ